MRDIFVKVWESIVSLQLYGRISRHRVSEVVNFRLQYSFLRNHCQGSGQVFHKTAQGDFY